MYQAGIDIETEQRKGPGGTAKVAEQPAAERPLGPSAGRRLAEAFSDVERFPTPIALRDRAARLAATEPFKADEFAAVVGADLGLALAVLRHGSRTAGRQGEVATVMAAIEVLGPRGLVDVVHSIDTYDPLGFSDSTDLAMQRARAHALEVRNMAVEICGIAGGQDPDEVSAAALMHDLGRLVVIRLHPDYEPEREFSTLTPEKRLRRERRRYGIDHTLVGGVLARRWDLPERMATAIERHHREDADGLAAIIGIADQITHHQAGDAVSLETLRRAAAQIGVDEGDLRRVLSGPSLPVDGSANGAARPCPLSDREIDALVLLSDGKVYKQIAEDMEVSVSTVRSHLHNVYGKLDVVDRAQAVLKARDFGWI